MALRVLPSAKQASQTEPAVFFAAMTL